MRSFPWKRLSAFILMVKQTAFADTGAARITVELVAMANFVPALAAFDGSIDELKHRTFCLLNQSRRARHQFVM
jgi:hypothetical protein